MSEPIQITKGATAAELAESLASVGEEIQARAEAQTREDVADALRDQFVDRSQSHCTFNNTPDDSIRATLRISGETSDRRFQALADRFDVESVSADFRLGLQFAIAMIRDPEFEL